MAINLSSPGVPTIVDWLTARVKISLTLAPALSVAITLTSNLPTFPVLGVPLKVRVVELKFSQSGNLLPSAKVAEYLIKSGITPSLSSVF